MDRAALRASRKAAWRLIPFLILSDKPREAAWLEPDERMALQARIDHERKSREAIRHYRLGEALTNTRVLGLSPDYA
jgi:MFS transporter, ACS family, tartrate transporter